VETWSIGTEEAGGVMTTPLASFILYKPDKHPWELMKDIVVGEPIQLVEDTDEEYRYLGVALVQSMKCCTLRMVDNQDLDRARPKYRCPLDLLKSLRKSFPEYKADFTGDTLVGVVTVQPLSYSLKSLNKIVGKAPQKLSKLS
jgi:hypothetical protein